MEETPEEKAKQLYNKYYSEFLQFDSGCNLSSRKKYAIKSSLLCVEEILSDTLNPLVFDAGSEFYLFWEKVRDELENFNLL